MFKFFLSLVLAINLLNANMFQSVSEKQGEFIKKENQFYCSSCAMNLPMHYKTNHTYGNEQYCSIHCLVEQTKDVRDLKNVKVVDTNSLKFIDAQTAFYVIGSKKKGTMTKKSKYAFRTMEEAKAFIAKNGGELANFQRALDEAKADFDSDKKMIQIRKDKMIYKTGKKLYESECDSLDVSKFSSIDELKTALKTSCKLKQDKQLQAVSIYLWDINKLGKSMREISSLRVPKDAKCSVCGMFVSKYPKWATKLEIDGKVHYFDGPKDLIKFIYKNNIKDSSSAKITVTDYFTTKAIDGKKAFFVMGSDVYGPMGKELIAFESDEAAFNFKNEHFGKRVLTFADITDEVLIYLD